MSLAMSNSLRQLELRLLLCSISSPSSTSNTATSPSSSLYPIISEIITSIEKGDYLSALSSEGACLIFQFAQAWDYEDTIQCAERFYTQVEDTVESYLEGDNDNDRACRSLLVMCVGVTAFLAFTQSNITGPVKAFPSLPLPFQPTEGRSWVEWDLWAHNQLMSGTGSALLGKYSVVQYIVYAKMLLVKIKDLSPVEKAPFEIGRSVSWWLFRIFLLQQRISDELSSSLFDTLQVLISKTLKYFGKVEDVKDYWGAGLFDKEASTVSSLAHLEAGIMEHVYGRDDQSRTNFKYAEEASGMQLSLTGVLGFRTVHQVDAKPQMVLITRMNTISIGDTEPSVVPELQRTIVSVNEDKWASQSCEMNEDSDILRAPKIVFENENNFGIDEENRVPCSTKLEMIQQAVILAQCLLIEKSTPCAENPRWEMAPFIEAVDAQQFSYFTIRCFCDILRIQWECTRRYTKDRALTMMCKLVDGVSDSSPGAAERILFAYSVFISTVPALRKEYGQLLVSCGMMGEALKIFEDLELWDDLIHCYCLLEKKAAAVELIKTRLCQMPNDPRLWCSLGDVTNNDTHYEKALEVSNNSSARAKRSLARSAYNKGNFEVSKTYWEAAMALNSLHPDGWFALGAAALKARDIEKASEGFTRAVQLDPDNGEAWNNIGCLHMMKKRNKEAFIAFKEALKFRRNSWQLWENYSQVAADIGNFGQALEASMKVLDITKNKRLDTEILERIMKELETRISVCNSPDANGDSVCNFRDDPKKLESGVETSRETDMLLELLGKVLNQIVRSGNGGGEVWGLYSRWHKIKGDLEMCSEALLKQIRSYQGAELWNSVDRFKKFANASVKFCQVKMELFSRSGSRQELNAAEFHLRNAVKQAINFLDTQELKDLQVCLGEVNKRLQAA